MDDFLEYAEHLIFAACRRLAGIGVKGMKNIVRRLRRLNGGVAEDIEALTNDGDAASTDTRSTSSGTGSIVKSSPYHGHGR